MGTFARTRTTRDFASLFQLYQQLKAKNKFLGGTGLKSAKEACKLFLSDNAVEETNLNLYEEQLGGFFFLEADNLPTLPLYEIQGRLIPKRAGKRVLYSKQAIELSISSLR